MTDGLRFDRDLYRGTAGYYDRFRIAYPLEMAADIVAKTQPSGTGRLLDLACGTGQITFAFAEHFGEVWAVDQEPDMIELVRRKAEAAGLNRVLAVVSSAEDLDAPAGGFELVAIGTAFHRLPRDAVAARAFCWLAPGGCIALLWSTAPSQGDRDWQHAFTEVLAGWMTKAGAESRLPMDWAQQRERHPDSEVLGAAGFEPVGSARFLVEHDWTIDALLGYVYSTAALPKAALGEQADAFERDVRQALEPYAAEGALRATIDFAYELARRAQS